MEAGSSLPSSQQPATSPYPEPEESTPQSPSIFVWVALVFHLLRSQDVSVSVKMSSA